MDQYATLIDEQSDMLAGVCAQLGTDKQEPTSTLRMEVCLELLAHLTRSRISMKGLAH